MGWPELRAKYGGNSKIALRRAMRAEIPGGPELLDAQPKLMTEADRPRHNRPPDQVRAIREANRALNAIVNGVLRAVMASYGIHGADADEEPPAPIPTRPASAPPAVTLESLKPPPPPRPIERPDNPREWRPPASIVERMGKESDHALATECGVGAGTMGAARQRLGIPAYEPDKDAHLWTPAMDKQLGTRPDADLGELWGRDREAVRRRREKLGIPPSRRKSAWTPERLAILRGESDNDRAAAKLGISVAAVKTARSRLSKLVQGE